MALPTAKVFAGSIPTPALILPSYHGHLLYSPPDLVAPLPPSLLREQQALNLSLSPSLSPSTSTSTSASLPLPFQLVLLDIVDLVGKDFGKYSLKELSAVNPQLVPILSYRGSHGAAVSADQKSISFDTKMGRKVVSLESYMERVVIEKPIATVALPDEVCMSGTGHNRLRKSIERTLTWFKSMKSNNDVTVNSSLFGTIVVDPNSKDQLNKMIEVFHQSNVKGVVVGGIHLGETAAARHNHIAAVRKEVGDSIFVLTHDADSIEEILTNIELGVDLIHTGYGLKLTRGGSALAFLNNANRNISNTTNKRSSGEEAEDEEEEGHPTKRAKNENDILSSMLCGIDEEGDGLKIKVDITPMDHYSINLWDPIFRKDTSPLLPGCQCFACLHHTRAYVHHLLKSKELLAEILLYLHNQYQLQELFCVAREQIRTNSFATWKSAVTATPSMNKNLD